MTPTHLLAIVLCLAGFAALAAATERQQPMLFGRVLPPASARRLRLTGAALLVGALAWLVAAQGWALGLVMYSGHTSLAAGCVHCALIVRARRQDARGAASPRR
ncbi:MAG: DUF3325 family protein [Lautropia sp.]